MSNDNPRPYTMVNSQTIGTGVVPSAHGLAALAGVAQSVLVTVGRVLGELGGVDSGVRSLRWPNRHVSAVTVAPAAM